MSARMVDADDVRAELITLDAARTVLDDLYNDYFTKDFELLCYTNAKKRMTAIAVLLRTVADNLEALLEEE